MNGVEYKIKELPIIQYIIRIALFIWIYFAYTMFEINPFFFGLTSTIATGIILTISERSIIVSNESLKYSIKKWLPILNKTQEFKYSEISKISYKNSNIDSFALLLNMIDYVPGTTKKDSKLLILMKNNASIEFLAVGNQSENERLIEIVTRKLIY